MQPVEKAAPYLFFDAAPCLVGQGDGRIFDFHGCVGLRVVGTGGEEDRGEAKSVRCVPARPFLPGSDDAKVGRATGAFLRRISRKLVNISFSAGNTACPD